MTSEQQAITVTRGLLGINVLTVLTTYSARHGDLRSRAPYKTPMGKVVIGYWELALR
jgi:hypothetical protein